MNEKNFEFYNNLGAERLKELADVGGFDTFKDLETAWPYIKDARSILEIGAGYGRCIDFFLSRKFKGKIIAVEQSAPLIEHLRKNYEGRVEILHTGINSFKSHEKIDTALWMWSGIIDFSKEEQQQTISHISSLLSPQGKLVIDIPRIGFQTYAQHVDSQNLVVNSDYGKLECYIPNETEITETALKAGYKNVVCLDYETTTQKKRTIYILEK